MSTARLDVDAERCGASFREPARCVPKLIVLTALGRAAGLVAPAADQVAWPRYLFWDAAILDCQSIAAGSARH